MNRSADDAVADRSKETAGWTTGALVPVAFVLCWATGFVVPRAFERYSEPLTFVLLRNAGALLVLLAIALALRRPWPQTRSEYAGLMWSGALLQGFSLALMYGAIYHGIPAGIAALVGGLQPAITAMLAAWMAGETLAGMQWLGIAIGFAGVALVVSPKLGLSPADLSPGLLLICLLGVASIAYGTIYQKRFEHTADAWTRTTVMFAGAVIPPALGLPLLEHGHITWAPSLIAVYVWSVLALAIGATMALLFLIQRGQAAKATALIYLVPPVSATIAYFAFGEMVGPVQIAGFAVAAIGVALVQKAGGKS